MASGSHGRLPAPADRRPYRLASEAGDDERILYHPEGAGVRREVLRQIGWHGASGAFYALDELPANHEPGSFSPLWLVVEAGRVRTPDPEDLTRQEKP